MMLPLQTLQAHQVQQSVDLPDCTGGACIAPENLEYSEVACWWGGWQKLTSWAEPLVQ